MVHRAPKPPLDERFLPLIFALLLSSVPPSEAQPDAYFRYSNCTPTPYQCGSVRFDVDYPFSVNGVDRPDYCSSRGYRLFCENGTLSIFMNSRGFQVADIDYSNHLLTVIDPTVAPGACPSSYRNTTIDGAMFAYTDRDAFLTFYINCSAQSPPLPPGYSIIDCFDGQSNYFATDNVSAPDVLGVCSSTLVVPYNWTMADSLRAKNSLQLNDGAFAAIGGGFTVRWKAGIVWCRKCQASGGRCGYSRSPKGHTCYCPDGQAIGSCSSGGGHDQKTRKIYIVASILVLCLLFFSFLLGYKKYMSKKKSKETPRMESFLQKNGTVHPRRYTYAQVKRMTRTLAEKLGQGGFGVVYRGNLSDGRQIAVKMLKNSKADVEEFMNEVASISRTSHVNVVTLLGFCLEGSKRALIYDYMPNGSLERYAFNGNSKGENTLSWEKLFDIAIGIARGLEYLHRGCNTRIVHFDIKPHNILLDEDFCPKISDFGLAKLCPNKESVISIGGARGTVGYIAPEVYSKQFGAVSSKSDVYSYGMMVLEMVGARDKNINANSESSSQYFPQWIYEHLDEYCVSTAAINGEGMEIVRKMIVVGLWCIQLSATNRPTMTRVVEMLEGSTSGLELPPQVLLS